jgi:hypothetical protein
VHDELDLLCKFFADGLFHERGELKNLGRVMLHGYTDVLDGWYIGRKHGADAKRPGFPVPPAVRALVTAIEQTGKPNRTAAALRLLELDQKGFNRIQEFLETFRPQCVADGRPHDVTLQFRSPMPRGVSVYITRAGGLPTDALQHAAMRKHMSGAQQWLAIGVRADDGSADFQFLSGGDAPAEIVERVDRMRRRLFAEFFQREQRVPDRNEQCPCLSGRKFKKCCSAISTEFRA